MNTGLARTRTVNGCPLYIPRLKSIIHIHSSVRFSAPNFTQVLLRPSCIPWHRWAYLPHLR